MIKENQQVINRIKAVIDGGLVGISFSLAYYLRFFNYDAGEYLPLGEYFMPIAIIIPVYLFLYSLFGLYLPQRKKGLTEECVNIVLANAICVILLLSVLYVLKQIDYSRLVIFLFVVINVSLTIAVRALMRWYILNWRKRDQHVKRVLVLGAGDLGQQYVEKAEANRDLGGKVVGFLDSTIKGENGFGGIDILGKIEDLEKVIEERQIDEVIVAISIKEYDQLQQIIETCEKGGVKVLIIPDYIKYIPAKPHLDEIDGLPLINIRAVPLDHLVNRLVKRLVDFSLSLIFIIVLFPLMIVIAALVKLTSPGPVLFIQERVGLNRSRFNMYKFRTMKVQSPSEEKTEWTTKEDPRKTRIGHYLRKTSLDELPQLFNVLMGEMSLIGPRPERPYFVDKFREKVPKYMLKHLVRPGITGWAQVNGWRGDTSIEERIIHDLYYIENWTFALDLRILFLTIYKGFVNKAAY